MNLKKSRAKKARLSYKLNCLNHLRREERPNE